MLRMPGDDWWKSLCYMACFLPLCNMQANDLRLRRVPAQGLSTSMKRKAFEPWLGSTVRDFNIYIHTHIRAESPYRRWTFSTSSICSTTIRLWSLHSVHSRGSFL